MANIKDLKKRIKSTVSTYKITSAMKLVSAAKLAKAQQAVVSARPYAYGLDETVRTLCTLSNEYTHNFLREDEDNKRAAVIVISSNRGLCGSFNNQLDKFIRKFIENNPKLELKFFFIGRKVKESLSKDVNVGKYFQFNKSEPSFFEIKNVGDEISELFSSGEFGKVFLAYNVFNSAISFSPVIKQVLPLSLPFAESQQLKREIGADFKYDEDPKVILDELLPQAYVLTLYTALLDATAAEHGIRMSSMDSATKNCGEMIRTLTLKMNKLRQAAITTELIEVVSGAESLKG